MPEGAAVAKVMNLSDGRKLTYFDNEIESNQAVLFHHGTPGSGALWQTWFDAAAERGIRAVAYTKAGYTGSERAPTRKVADASEDFLELLETLGIEEFVSVGWSGGGPYALHSTFAAGCLGADLVAGVGPFFEMGEDFLIGLSEAETMETLNKVAVSLESAYATALTEMANIEQEWTPETWTAGAKASPNYAEFEELYETFNSFALPALLNAMAPDLSGYADDNHLILIDWGFEVRDVAKQVSIWNGTQDKLVSVNHATWLNEQIAGSELHILDGQNHTSIMVEAMKEVLDSAIAKLKG
jgi:pimeloyl-ACP methyl ester carboxylesterase